MKLNRLLFVVTCLTASLLHAEDAKQKALTVNDLAAHASDHLGKVAVVGVAAIITPSKGFVMVDQREYDDCGLKCLTEAATKRIPVQWRGAPPKLEETVRVEGTLSRIEKGFSLAAQRVAKP